jgi:chaperonin GroES
MELINLASQLDNDELKEIAQLVYNEYEQDDQSRQGWLEKHARWLQLYYQTDKTAIEDWQSSESIPILTEACNLFQARAYKAFFPTRDFIQALPAGDQSSGEILAAAERVGRHMSYQLSVQDRNYKPDKNAMFLATPLHGSDFSKTYRDPIKNRNMVERVRAVDLVLPYGTGPMHLSDIERKTQIIYESVNKTKILAKNGFFLQAAVPMDSNPKDSAPQDVVDEAHGLEKPSTTDNIDTAFILEQHRLLDLDDDGIAEPYIVWLDATSMEVLRIQIRYEVDDQGNATNNKEPIEYFTQYNFLTNPDGVYGLGYGHVVGELNLAINKLLRQVEDAATLANAGNMSGYISEGLGIKGGDNDISIGRMKKIPKSVDDIRKGIYTMQFPGANPTLVNALEMLISTAQRVSSTTDAVTGDIEKVVQPLTIMTLLESSLQLPTSVMEQMALSFEDELDKLYRLNQKYMDKAEALIDGDTVEMVTPQDYQQKLRLIPIIDPKEITRQQKLAKIQQLWQFAMSNPIIAQNPQSLQEITVRYLKALNVEDIDKILPPPPQPQEIDSQDLENMYFLLPAGSAPLFDVFPMQDHQTHIRKIDSLINILSGIEDPQIINMDPVVLQVVQGVSAQEKQEIVTQLMQHRRKHVAYFYGGRTVGQGQIANMASTGGNPMGAQAGNGALPPAGGLGMQPGQSGAFAGPAGGITAASGSHGGSAPQGILGLSSLAPPTIR